MNETRGLALPSGRFLDFTERAAVMAIINCTPDSFYSGSRVSGVEAAVERALAAEAAGADIIDLGGESTRPNSSYVDAREELDRVLPVVEGIRRWSGIPLSIDTRKAAVARAALDAGAEIINDISALEDDPELGPLCAARGAAVVLMHKKGTPASMQDAPFYADVIVEVRAYLEEAARRAETFGIPRGRIVLDPGFGFGKRLEDNLDLLARLAEIGRSGYPVLVGVSRKGFIGTVTGKPVEGRLAGTLAANAVAVAGGANILRVHDAAEAADLVRILSAVEKRKGIA